MSSRKNDIDRIDEGWHFVDHRHVAPWTRRMDVSEPQPRQIPRSFESTPRQAPTGKFILRPVSSHLTEDDDDWDTLETSDHYEFHENNGTEKRRRELDRLAREKKNREFRRNQSERAKEQRHISSRVSAAEQARIARREENKRWFENGGRSGTSTDSATPGPVSAWVLWAFGRDR